MSINAQTFTIEDMIKSKMVFFKKNGQVDKRCSAFKQKIVDENCNIILKPAKVVPQLEDVTDSDSDSESCYTVDDDDTASFDGGNHLIERVTIIDMTISITFCLHFSELTTSLFKHRI